MAFELPERIKQISELLNTQDNDFTASPIFQVMGLKRVYGMDPDYADSSHMVWLDEEGIEVVEEERTNGSIYVAYMDTWEVITQFFTREAAETYLEYNKHRHSRYLDFRIYTDSLYRNSEMIAIREFLKSLTNH